MTRSLARLLNESPEFSAGVSQPSSQVLNDRPLVAETVLDTALPPAHFDALWSRVFGGVTLPPRK